MGKYDKVSYQGRSTSIDSLRGIAAVFVIFYHAILYDNETALSLLNPPIQDLGSNYLRLLKILLTVVNGHNAVLLFFVLSGFVLMLSMDKEYERGQWSNVAFVVRRFMRLFPPLLVALLVCFLLGSVAVKLGVDSRDFSAAADPIKTIKNMLLWEIVTHGATWTIQVEFLAIPFLLFGFWASRLFGVAGLIACLAVSLLETERPFFTTFSPALSGSLCAFYAGMVAAKLTAARASTADNNASIMLMVVIYAFVSLFAPLSSKALLIAQVLACAGLIVAVYTCRDCFAIRVLNGKHLLRLGRISYSLYLLNVPVLWVMLSAAERSDMISDYPVIRGVIVGVVTTLITIPIADLFERAIERPANALGKRLTMKCRTPERAPAE